METTGSKLADPTPDRLRMLRSCNWAPD